MGTRGCLAITAAGLALVSSVGISAPPPTEGVVDAANDRGEDVRKLEILASERWRRAMFEFTAWLDAQSVYTPKQVRGIRRELADRVAGMSSFELEYLLETMDDKLEVLDSPAAREARSWLGHYLAVMSDGKRAEVLKDVPDVLDMTAAELEAAIKQVEAKRAEVERQRDETIAAQAGFARFQQTTRATAAAERARLSAVRGGAPAFSPYRGPPVESPPFAGAYDSPTVVGVGPWGTYLAIPTTAF